MSNIQAESTSHSYWGNVFNPFEDNVQIGEIDERWEHLDITLAKLNASVKFNNCG